MNTLQGYICNSRPRRFGKSITANMLTAYYSKGCDSKEMFSNLEISKTPDFEKRLNKYDVIHVDIQWCMEPAGGADNIVSYISEKTISELKEYYPDVLTEHLVSLPEVLSKINTETGTKFIVIIDEWDVLIRDKAADQKIQDEYIGFLRGLFKGTEPTKYIRLAYLTGILPIKKEKTQSALNNFDEFTMLSPGKLAQYIGFTEEEVRELSGSYHQEFEKVKRWYDGYLLRDYQVYNPRAVVSVMLNSEYKSYWSETASYEAIVSLINMNYDGLKTAIIEIISGAAVKVNTATFKNDTVNIQSKDDVLTYMIHLGYLGYDQVKKMALFRMKKFVRSLLRQSIVNHGMRCSCSSRNQKICWRQHWIWIVLQSRTKLKKFIEYASVIQYHNENSLSSVLTISYLSAMQYYFKPVRELPTGRGFADFVFIPKPEYKNDYPALIVELKWNQNAQTAMEQIKEKKYPSSVLDYTGNILLVAINYDKATKEHQCIIEEYEKAESL